MTSVLLGRKAYHKPVIIKAVQEKIMCSMKQNRMSKSRSKFLLRVLGYEGGIPGSQQRHVILKRSPRLGSNGRLSLHSLHVWLRPQKSRSRAAASVLTVGPPLKAAERDWEEKRAALTQYSTKDINRLLEETQAELLKAIPDLDSASKAHPGPAPTPDHKPPQTPHGQKAAPRTEPSGRRGSGMGQVGGCKEPRGGEPQPQELSG